MQVKRVNAQSQNGAVLIIKKQNEGGKSWVVSKKDAKNTRNNEKQPENRRIKKGKLFKKATRSWIAQKAKGLGNDAWVWREKKTWTIQRRGKKE